MKARKTNPNLHLFCELFTINSEVDAEFAKRLGANALVREIKQCHDFDSVFGSIDFYGRYY